MQNLVNQEGVRYGRVIVTKELGYNQKLGGQRVRMVEFKCDCGKLKTVRLSSLRNGTCKSCGCWHDESARMPRSKLAKGLKIGASYGRLTLSEVYYDHNAKAWKANTKCTCGEVKTVCATNLALGYTKSCGCLRLEKLRSAVSTHGMTGSPTHVAWSGMKARCKGRVEADKRNYADRGISVCRRWNNFSNFLKDMGIRPSDLHSLDRIDNDKGYSKDNCRWATRTQQNNNTRRNIWLTWSGHTKTLRQWSAHLKVSYSTLYGRFKKGLPIEEIFKPVCLSK